MSQLPAYVLGEPLNVNETMADDKLLRQLNALTGQNVVYSCWQTKNPASKAFYSGLLSVDMGGNHSVDLQAKYWTKGTEAPSQTEAPIPATGYTYGILVSARAFVEAQATEIILDLKRQLAQQAAVPAPATTTTRDHFVPTVPETWGLLAVDTPTFAALRAILMVDLQVAGSAARRVHWDNLVGALALAEVIENWDSIPQFIDHIKTLYYNCRAQLAAEAERKPFGELQKAVAVAKGDDPFAEMTKAVKATGNAQQDRQANTNPSAKLRGKCYKCNKPGHFAKDCKTGGAATSKKQEN